jgi:hypothetical protein
LDRHRDREQTRSALDSFLAFLYLRLDRDRTNQPTRAM